jgi:hypothetical protein
MMLVIKAQGGGLVMNPTNIFITELLDDEFETEGFSVRAIPHVGEFDELGAYISRAEAQRVVDDIFACLKYASGNICTYEMPKGGEVI